MEPVELLEECARVSRQYGLTRARVCEGDVSVEIELAPVGPASAEQPAATGGSPATRDELDELGAEWDRRVRGAEP